jgi:hypothetical protein
VVEGGDEIEAEPLRVACDAERVGGGQGGDVHPETRVRHAGSPVGAMKTGSVRAAPAAGAVSVMTVRTKAVDQPRRPSDLPDTSAVYFVLMTRQHLA